MKYRLCPWVLQPCQSVGIHVISMTSRGLLKAGYEKIMREDVPVPPVEDPAGQMQADRAFFFFFGSCRRWQTLIVCSLTKNNSRNKRSGSNGVKGMAERHATSWDERRSLHVFTQPLNHGWHMSSLLIKVGDLPPYSPKQRLLKNTFANDRPGLYW